VNRTLRLLCTLLVILLAIPAMQARACAPIAAEVGVAAPAHHAGHHMAHGHHGGGSDQQAPAPTSIHHDCIGCIAPIDRDFYRPVAVPTVMSLHHAGPVETPFRLYSMGAPEPPPPRLPV